MIKWMVDRLAIFLAKSHTEVGEYILGLFSLLWGIWLLLPVWNTFSINMFSAFLHVAPEEIWGLAAVSLGVITIFSAAIKDLPMRKTSTFINIIFWLFISFMFLLATPKTTAIPIYAMLALQSFWRYVKLTFYMNLEKRFTQED